MTVDLRIEMDTCLVKSSAVAFQAAQSCLLLCWMLLNLVSFGETVPAFCLARGKHEVLVKAKCGLQPVPWLF